MTSSSSSSTSEDLLKSDVVLSPLKGYVYICVGILFLLSPILSSVSYYFLPQHGDDGKQLPYLLEYWNETGPFMRVLTVLPATLVICICHWVSFRIYLRR